MWLAHHNCRKYAPFGYKISMNFYRIAATICSGWLRIRRTLKWRRRTLERLWRGVKVIHLEWWIKLLFSPCCSSPLWDNRSMVDISTSNTWIFPERLTFIIAKFLVLTKNSINRRVTRVVCKNVSIIFIYKSEWINFVKNYWLIHKLGQTSLEVRNKIKQIKLPMIVYLSLN